MTGRDWRNQAACLGYPTNMFFPDPSDEDGIRSAKLVCADCPVKQACLDSAVACGDFDGVFGETTGAERRMMAGFTARLGVELECRTCGGTFVKNASTRRYCSVACRDEFWRRQSHKRKCAA